MPTRPHRGALAVLLALVIATASVACADGIEGAGDRGYIDGSGIFTLLPPQERGKPGPVSGTTLDGAEVSLSDYAGKVVVINVWGAWCPPCRAEADDLAAAAAELMPQGVVFLGINTRDTSIENAQAFERSREVPYPSIYDPGGRNLLAFSKTLSPNSIPSTVVIDVQGRVAASILGEVTSSQSLIGLVEDVSR